MYEKKKVDTDSIDEVLEELSNTIWITRERLIALDETYEEAHNNAVKAMKVFIDATVKRDKTHMDLTTLENISEMLRLGKIDIGQAYEAWSKRHKS